MTSTRPHIAIWRRYERLVLPFLAALAIGIGAAAIGRTALAEEWIPSAPTIGQILSHMLLLQGVLEFDALIAGAWYIAIDFQLFALMVALIWLSDRLGAPNARTRFVTPTLVAILGTASLYYFNCDSAWDNLAIYFFGSYALGACAYWASHKEHSLGWFFVLTLVATGALLMDFRLRIAVALAVALVLGLSRRSGLFENLPLWRPITYLGRTSYSMFLIHFAICLVANAAFAYVSPAAEMALPWLLGTWITCVAAGALLFHSVEDRVGRAGPGALRIPLWRNLAGSPGGKLYTAAFSLIPYLSRI
ncbi:MAG: acyltransferase [Rhodocyclaceae bacterium]|nr:acyltransferase [Rhodocyclaceae bacterium]